MTLSQSLSLTAAAIITERSAHTVTHPYMTAWESQSKWWYWTMIVTIINGGQCLPRGLSCALAARDFHQLISRELAVVVVDRARVVVGGGVVRGRGGCAPRPRERDGRRQRPRPVRDREHVERLVDGAAVRHLGRAARSRLGHPRGQHAARQSLEVHARDVAKPAQLPPRDVHVDGFE